MIRFDLIMMLLLGNHLICRFPPHESGFARVSTSFSRWRIIGVAFSSTRDPWRSARPRDEIYPLRIRFLFLHCLTDGRTVGRISSFPDRWSNWIAVAQRVTQLVSLVLDSMGTISGIDFLLSSLSSYFWLVTNQRSLLNKDIFSIQRRSFSTCIFAYFNSKWYLVFAYLHISTYMWWLAMIFAYLIACFHIST